MSSSIDEGKMLLTLSLVVVSSIETLTSFSESAMICSIKNEKRKRFMLGDTFKCTIQTTTNLSAKTWRQDERKKECH